MNYNQVLIAGNLVRDPEIRYIGSGAAVTKFTLAINTGKNREDAEFIDVVCWEKLAENTNTFLKKGQNALVSGRLSIRSYETKDGDKRKATEVVASRVEFGPKPGSRSESGAAAPAGNADGNGFEEDAALEDAIPF